jgi:hypothetical protein
MVKGADLRELIERTPGSLRTLHCRQNSWGDGYVAATARHARFAPLLRPRGSAGLDWPRPDIHEGRRRIWFEPPDRWRVASDPGLGMEPALYIADGDVHWEGNDRLLRRSRDPGLYDWRDPAWSGLYLLPSLPWLRLGEPTSGDYEGRSVWVIAARDDLDRADSSPTQPPQQLTLAPGVDHQFTLDALTGIVLRHEASFEGAPCLRTELSEVVVDQPIDPALFRPPPGAQVDDD